MLLEYSKSASSLSTQLGKLNVFLTDGDLSASKTAQRPSAAIISVAALADRCLRAGYIPAKIYLKERYGKCAAR
jgi:hypothetical protein